MISAKLEGEVCIATRQQLLTVMGTVTSTLLLGVVYSLAVDTPNQVITLNLPITPRDHMVEFVLVADHVPKGFKFVSIQIVRSTYNLALTLKLAMALPTARVTIIAKDSITPRHLTAPRLGAVKHLIMDLKTTDVERDGPMLAVTLLTSRLAGLQSTATLQLLAWPIPHFQQDLILTLAKQELYPRWVLFPFHPVRPTVSFGN